MAKLPHKHHLQAWLWGIIILAALLVGGPILFTAFFLITTIYPLQAGTNSINIARQP